MKHVMRGRKLILVNWDSTALTVKLPSHDDGADHEVIFRGRRAFHSNNLKGENLIGCSRQLISDAR